MTAKGAHEEALALWEELGVLAAEREKLEQRDEDDGLPKGVKMSDLLNVFGKSVWRQTFLGVFLMAMQQLSGIDGVLYVRISLPRDFQISQNNILTYSNSMHPSSSNPPVSNPAPHPS